MDGCAGGSQVTNSAVYVEVVGAGGREVSMN